MSDYKFLKEDSLPLFRLFFTKRKTVGKISYRKVSNEREQ